MNSALVTRREGAVLILSNNNPAARNALSPEYYHAVMDGLRAAGTDASVAAIILTGEGGHFCAGGDLNQLATRRAMPLAERRIKLEDLNHLIRAIRDCPKPVIAAIEGAAAGAGLSLAMACDLLVAAKSAVFSVAYVKVGLTPDGGATSFLAEFVSRQVLTELCLTGERISGERMHALGCINRLTETGAALPAALALAQQLAQGPEVATARIKTLCRVAHHHSLEEQLALEADYMVEAQGSEESREGIGAFLEKRAPDFARLRSAE